MPTPKTAIVLFQLGGPDSLEAVEPFLHNLFMDPDIIDFPLAFLARRPLARLISSKRAPKVQENYKLIGGKSPILELTKRQADGLEQKLLAAGIDAKVFIAMRYWHPMTDEAVRAIQGGDFTNILLLPLYPHYSQATTYSSVNEWNRWTKRLKLNLPTQLVCCYPEHPLFIEALAENINLALQKFPQQEQVELVFSAHGVPVSYIEKGDPYQLHIEETVRCVLQRGGWKNPHTLCFQSKVGPMQWLKPSLIETVQHLAETGSKRMLVIPIAFVTDHIETLHEINIDVRERAMHAGIEQFELMPALNDHPKFIACLTDLVQRQSAHPIPRTMCSMLADKKSKYPCPVKCPQMK
jgi:protoporphyrin/coproporphyrin ferrochelatase